MKFTVEGATLPMPGDDPPPVQRAKAALNALPVGKLWTIEKTAEAAGLSLSHFGKYSRAGFESHRVKAGFRYLYGSPKTIQLWHQHQAKLASAKR